MLVKKFLILFVLIFIANTSFANFEITEIAYDISGSDSGREWIEVKNIGGDKDDLSVYKLFEAETNHGIVFVSGSTVVDAGGFAVIADNPDKFRADNPFFAGNLFNSSFSLSNEGETLVIKNSDLSISDSVTYFSKQGASGDGNSLQKINSIWVVSAPTPGFEVSSINTVASQDDNKEILTDNTKGQMVKKITTTISGSNFIFSKTEANLSINVIGLSGENITSGRFIWNFGDGTTLQNKTNQKVSHIYKYAGDYVVALDYYANDYNNIPDSSVRFNISVIDSSVVINRVESEGDNFTELYNKGSKEANIGRWVLVADDKRFTIPENTIISAGKKIIFSGDTTQFTGEDLTNLQLLFPTGFLAFSFLGNIENKIQKVAQKRESAQVVSKDYKKSEIVPIAKDSTTTATTSLDSALVASVANTNPFYQRTWFYISLVFIIALIGSFAFLFSVKQKPPLEGINEDLMGFEIIEKEDSEI